MPITKLRAGEWLPDAGELSPYGLFKVKGVVPVAGTYGPAPAVKGRQDSDWNSYAIDDFGGLHIHPIADSNSVRFFVGTDDELWRGTAEDVITFESATGATTPYSGFDTLSGWQFVSFGDNVLATNFTDPIQIATTPATDFADNNVVTAPVTYDPRARFIGTIANRVLIANVQFDAAPSASIPKSALTGTDYPSLVMWSANDNARRWGDPKGCAYTETLGSDYQNLIDEYGQITGIVGGHEYAYIFKTRAIYRMDGPPFTFRPIVTGVGTIWPNSFIKYYDDLYFWSDSGPMVLRAGSSRPERLGISKVQRTILDEGLNSDYEYYLEDSALSPIQMNGIVDYRSGLIGWISSCTNSNLTVWTPGSRILIYNTDEDRFGFFKIDRPLSFPKSIPNYNTGVFSFGLPDAITYGKNYAFDGTYFIVPTSTNVSSYDIALGAFIRDDDDMTAETANGWPIYDNPVFGWPYLSFPVGEGAEVNEPSASRILRVRPVYTCRYGYNDEERPLKVQVTVNSKSRFPGSAHSVTKTYSPYSDTYQDSNGWIDINSVYATHHQIEIELMDPSEPFINRKIRDVAYARDLITLEVEFDNGMRRGGAYIA